MSAYDINWSALLSASSGNVSPGYGACFDAAGVYYLVATTANLAAAGGLISGIILTAGAPSGTVAIQYTGEIPPAITGLGAGAAGDVSLDATGKMVRGSSLVIGQCNATGTVKLGSSSTTAGAGDWTGQAGANTVVQVTGTAGVLPVLATEVDQTGDTKCKPFTKTTHYVTTGSGQETAYTGPTPSAGGVKVNVAVVATNAAGAQVASWDISTLFRYTGGVLTQQGTVPSSSGVAPDNNSSGASAWLATVDSTGTTPRVRVTGGASGVEFGIVYQSIPVVP